MRRLVFRISYFVTSGRAVKHVFKCCVRAVEKPVRYVRINAASFTQTPQTIYTYIQTHANNSQSYTPLAAVLHTLCAQIYHCCESLIPGLHRAYYYNYLYKKIIKEGLV